MIFSRMISAEFLKLKRSRITWILAGVYGLSPLMLGLMMVVLKNPDLGRRMGLITMKAEMMVGAANWPTYLSLTAFLFAGGVMVIGIIEAYLFGREYVEGTAKNMLILPIGRAIIVSAKLIVSAVWFLAMALIVYAEAIGIAFAIGLPGFDAELLATNALRASLLVLQVILLSSISAWITAVSRGYLAPVGLNILLFLIGDLFAHTGWSRWVPWSIVLVTAGVAEGTDTAQGLAAVASNSPEINILSMVVLISTFAVGFFATFKTIDGADNTQ